MFIKINDDAEMCIVDDILILIIFYTMMLTLIIMSMKIKKEKI